MKTFIKWAGGKEKELPIIMANLPKEYTLGEIIWNYYVIRIISVLKY